MQLCIDVSASVPFCKRALRAGYALANFSRSTPYSDSSARNRSFEVIVFCILEPIRWSLSTQFLLKKDGAAVLIQEQHPDAPWVAIGFPEKAYAPLSKPLISCMNVVRAQR